jgi:hypothetical protein
MLGDLRQPQRLGIPDQLTQDAVSAGQVPDPGALIVADADGVEFRERAIVADDAQGSVLGVDEDPAASTILAAPARGSSAPVRWRARRPQQAVHAVLGAAGRVDPRLHSSSGSSSRSLGRCCSGGPRSSPLIAASGRLDRTHADPAPSHPE